MKLISWNVNGLRACVKKGFEEFFNEIDADVFCIQESKLQEGQIDLKLEGYQLLEILLFLKHLHKIPNIFHDNNSLDFLLKLVYFHLKAT